MYKKLFFYIMFSLVLMPSLQATSIYKWVDEDGHVHYGSKAQSKQAKEMQIKNRYIDSGNSAPPLSAKERVNKQKRFINALEAENKSVEEVKRKKREKEEQRISRCNASRDQLKRAEAASALYDLDEKGNRILLNKKQYQQAMSQAKARVDKWCQ